MHYKICMPLTLSVVLSLLIFSTLSYGKEYPNWPDTTHCYDFESNWRCFNPTEFTCVCEKDFDVWGWGPRCLPRSYTKTISLACNVDCKGHYSQVKKVRKLCGNVPNKSTDLTSTLQELLRDDSSEDFDSDPELSEEPINN